MKKRGFKICYLVLFCMALWSCKNGDQSYTLEDVQIIPKPKEISIKPGAFQFDKNTVLALETETQRDAALLLKNKLLTAAGLDLSVTTNPTKINAVSFKTDEALQKDAYQLKVTSQNVVIAASSFGGFVYGVQSLTQLLPPVIEGNEQTRANWVVPNVSINDEPRFAWRGLMLDVSRHFFDKAYVKQVIDGLAYHKMNVLHLHLVDDQGWRMEIKKYPELTKIGAWRVDQEDQHWNAREKTAHGEKGTYGGFYTQEDLKELVAYAQKRNVEIIPEIEMPAHVTSAIAAYPELACFNQKVGVPSGGVWPITDIYCAGKESTFEFLEDVIDEVIEVFPSKYIHVGGDEATKTNWEKCPHCAKRMKNENLENVASLQSYFIKRMEKYINSKGKQLIGWDEILEGGLAPEATVMSWRGIKGGVEAAKQGHDVVMTPVSHCYFDYYQGPQNEEPLAFGGYLPLSKVYEFDPVVEELTVEEAKHILGGQANLWSEYIPTNEHSEYMIYPRIAALAEAVWTDKSLKNWEDFVPRIEQQFKRYKYQGINFAQSAYLIYPSVEVDLEQAVVHVTLQNEFVGSDIRYVFNEAKLDGSAIQYKVPIQLSETTIIKASRFEEDKPVGKVFTDTIKFHQAIAKSVAYKNTYHENYQGKGEFSLVNALRGSKNFRDGQWQAWLNNDMEVTIDLGSETTVSEVIVGSMENQGPDIYFPTQLEVWLSVDGKDFKSVSILKRPFTKNGNAELKDFKLAFNATTARYVKVKANNLKSSPKGGGTWLFIDEILVN